MGDQHLSQILIAVFVCLLGGGSLLRLAGNIGGYPLLVKAGIGLTLGGVGALAILVLLTVAAGLFCRPRVRREKEEAAEQDPPYSH